MILNIIRQMTNNQVDLVNINKGDLMDNEFSTSDVVSAIMTGDNNRARESVLGLLSKKSMDELEVRKAEIAQTLFKDAPVDGEQPEQEMQVVDPANGQPTGEVVNQMSDQEPEIQEPVQ